jgi:hypothetical protein
MAPSAVEVTQEVLVVVRTDGPRLGAGSRPGTPQRSASALDEPDDCVRDRGEHDHHQQHLEHVTSVGRRWWDRARSARRTGLGWWT